MTETLFTATEIAAQTGGVLTSTEVLALLPYPGQQRPTDPQQRLYTHHSAALVPLAAAMRNAGLHRYWIKASLKHPIADTEIPALAHSYNHRQPPTATERR